MTNTDRLDQTVSLASAARSALHETLDRCFGARSEAADRDRVLVWHRLEALEGMVASCFGDEVDARVGDEIEECYREAERHGLKSGRGAFVLTASDIAHVAELAGRRPTNADVRVWRRAMQDRDDEERQDRERDALDEVLLARGFTKDPLGAGVLGWIREREGLGHILVTEGSDGFELGIYDEDDNRLGGEVYPTADILIFALTRIAALTA